MPFMDATAASAASAPWMGDPFAGPGFAWVSGGAAPFVGIGLAFVPFVDAADAVGIGAPIGGVPFSWVRSTCSLRG
jgi:hypothetical protein